MWCALRVLQRNKQDSLQMVSCISVDTSGAPSADTQLPHPGTALTGAETYHCTHQSTAKSHVQQAEQGHRAINTTMQFSTKNAVNDSCDACDPQGCSNSWPSILS